MNLTQQMVRFTCPACVKRLKIPVANADRPCRCPRCLARIENAKQLQTLAASQVANPPEVIPFVLPAPKKQATVPLKLALPKNLGGMETTVSQGTANSVVKVATGGFLVVLGVVVAAMFGIRRPGA